MFCKNCGKEINNNAVVCPHCGTANDNLTQSANKYQVVHRSNGLAVAGFVLSLIMGGLISLIISICGYTKSQEPEYDGDGRGLAIAGIVISSIELAGVLILIFALIGLGSCASITM